MSVLWRRGQNVDMPDSDPNHWEQKERLRCVSVGRGHAQRARKPGFRQHRGPWDQFKACLLGNNRLCPKTKKRTNEFENEKMWKKEVKGH